jgi:3-oxoacyl-[acyl-carrier-protein] synthase II
MELKRVVVTGLGALTPIGNTVEEFWQGLTNGVSGAAPITHFDASKFKTQFACEVKGYDAEDHFDRNEARKLDPYAQYALVTAEQAMKDSGIDLEKTNTDRFGVIWGSGIGGLQTFQEECFAFAKGDGTPRFNPFFIPKMIADIASGHISIKYGLRGPNFTTVSACASSTNALADAYNYIRLGKADLFVTGGSEATVNEAGIGGFNALHALSKNNENYKTASRPFDKTRDGFVLGEGSGALILEEYEHAKARGARIYGRVLGVGMTSDSHHIAAPDPEGAGQTKAMQYALENADVAVKDVCHVNAHATSTPVGDMIEARGIRGVLGSHADQVLISATKSMTGHLLGGAGALESVFTILALDKRTAPPTINVDNPDPELELDLVRGTPRPLPAEGQLAAINNSFGFGGHNVALVFASN